MFSIALDGLDEASARLDACPTALSAALVAKASELAAALADKVRNDKLSGSVLNPRSGALKASIVTEVLTDGDEAKASVGSDGSVKYAAIHEYGGKTGAYEILPVKARALAFIAGGGLRFARRVEHPGSLIPERSYLRSSIEEMGGEIVSAFADAATQACEGG